ncbi:sugar ABC transporter permease [Demequina sp. TTPB684]|uniref:carbohydrate ABC transporter permease n=1 Tax=unclassified Demequina TaxID=2620311 RepID=UPI001CF5C143|nr:MULTISPECIES: sugar ABC transporter permease [unclassified Demequina]MCB2412913.1 sugar ABC transporter permease [Demequina sp. TTPB684]UPU87862.1 sugar ABC transporter permease [Demequina sp. TMPB413]
MTASRRTGTSLNRRPSVSEPSLTPEARRRADRARRLRRGLPGLALVAPAAIVYAVFVLTPLGATIQYSFYEWDGITQATWIGFDNYARLFTDEELFGSILNAFQLILYFSLVPVTLGLIAAALIRKFGTSRLALVSRTVLFLPQVIPLVAAGIMWTWLMATDGAVNQFFRLIGLGDVTRAWLGDFDTALPAVGVIGAWVSLGLCMLLLLAGMTKIDPALYEAVRLDGAGPVREFMAVTFPAVRQELGVAITITVISALRSFDIIYISTQGGPGNSTLVPGLEIYYLAFLQREIGQASALAVALTVLVLAVVLPLHRLARGKEES